MKRQTAKEILAASFRELAETKNIDKITVRDITEILRSTTVSHSRHCRKTGLARAANSQRINSTEHNQEKENGRYIHITIEIYTGERRAA